MRVGAVDIGTNSMRLLVADRTGSELSEIERVTTITRLGEGVDRRGMFGAGPIERTLVALRRYGQSMQEAGVERKRAVATSATRDAANRAGFLARAETALGVSPEVISGEEEAALSFAGAGLGLPPGSRRRVVIDIGGGSTELVAGLHRPDFARSLEVGSVRLTERVVPDRPAPAAQVQAATSAVEQALRPVDLDPAPEEAVGVAGTFTSLAAMALDLSAYDRAAVHGSRLSSSQLSDLVVWLASLTVEETAGIGSLAPGRAPVILAGAIIARIVVDHLGLEQIVISEHDLLDGVALTA